MYLSNYFNFHGKLALKKCAIFRPCKKTNVFTDISSTVIVRVNVCR